MNYLNILNPIKAHHNTSHVITAHHIVYLVLHVILSHSLLSYNVHQISTPYVTVGVITLIYLRNPENRCYPHEKTCVLF